MKRSQSAVARTGKVGLMMLALTACGGGGGAQPVTPGGGGTPAKLDQVATGKKLFAENCASCHGASGEGANAPAVIGKAALPVEPRSAYGQRKGQFQTAADLAKFVIASMPPGQGGTLKDDEYWAIVAYNLQANGIDLKGKTLDPALAGTIKLHE